MATKIKLMRLGKMRAPYYRVVVADSRTKRDGRSIETIGKYHPKEDPSYIEIDPDRAAYWLGVGAQPTEAVEALLKVTGDWQKFKGLPAPPPMLVKEAKADKKATFEAAAKGGAEADAEVAEKPAKKAKATKAEPAKDEAKGDDAKVDDAKVDDAKVDDAKVDDAKVEAQAETSPEPAASESEATPADAAATSDAATDAPAESAE